MGTALLIFPNFALILIGFALARGPWAFGRGFWDGLEKLVYYALFPALLFRSEARGLDRILTITYAELADQVAAVRATNGGPPCW